MTTYDPGWGRYAIMLATLAGSLSSSDWEQLIPPPVEPGTSHDIDPAAVLARRVDHPCDRRVTLAPPPDDELVLLETIRLTAQRARAAQRVIRQSGGRLAARLDLELESSRISSDGGSPDGDDVDLDEHDIDRIRCEPMDSIYVGAEELDLPAPSVTNTNLHHYLTAAGKVQPGFYGGPRRLRSRLRAMFRRRRQDDFNTAVLHALHQLDHRTRVQSHVIVQLEAKLAEVLRRADCESSAQHP